MSFLTRYEDDASAPTVKEALRDLAVRVLAPGLVLFGVVVGLGKLIVASKAYTDAEEKLVNRSLAAERDSLWNAITNYWSHIGNTEYVIGVCVIVALIVWWRTKQWWYAVIPALAITLQASVFVPATAVTGRERPHVEHLDPAPPTSSYPSGHMGASTALYLTFAVMAQRIERTWLRRLVTAVCVVVPLLVGYARVFRGMHHVTDVTVGALNGIVCTLLAWHALRRRPQPAAAPDRAEQADARAPR